MLQGKLEKTVFRHLIAPITAQRCKQRNSNDFAVVLTGLERNQRMEQVLSLIERRKERTLLSFLNTASENPQMATWLRIPQR